MRKCFYVVVNSILSVSVASDRNDYFLRYFTVILLFTAFILYFYDLLLNVYACKCSTALAVKYNFIIAFITEFPRES